MPIEWERYTPKPPTCSKPYRWSTMRGGCRFEPNHAGDCKPTAGRR